MNPGADNGPTWQQRLPVAVASAAAILGGAMVLCGWLFDISALKSIQPGWVAMKPNTAVAFILTGIALANSPNAAPFRSFGTRLCSWLVGLLGVLTLAEYACGWNPGFDHWLFTEPTGAMGTSHPGRMAPDAAVCFVALAAGLSLSHCQAKSGGRFIASVLLGSLVTALALVEILSYLAPSLRVYGWGGLTMMALPTAVLFAMLGAALILDTWQKIRSESSSHATSVAGLDSRTGLAYLLVFLLLSIGIIAVGVFCYRYYEQRFRMEIERQLLVIAELKVSELIQYRMERLADADLLFQNAPVTGLVERFVDQPGDSSPRRQLQALLEKFESHVGYDEVRLMDGQGATLLSSPADLPPAATALTSKVAEVLRSGQVAFLDFYRSESEEGVHLGLLIPILSESEPARPLGVIVLRINPQSYLYPFIKRWPTPSASAETLLVRREGHEAVFLNELRFQANAALTLRAPLDNANLPAAQAALGREGVMDGIDYRGVPVVAVLRTIADSPWALVARIDATEVYAPLRAQLWQVIATVGILLFGAAAGVGGIWWQQRARFFLGQAASAAEIRQLNQTLEKRVVERTAQLEASNRELAAFSYSVAHDLRSPLRAMDGFSAALLEDCSDRLDAEALSHLHRIRAGSQRMAVLIDDLLNLSRETRAEMRREPVDLTALAAEIGEDLRRAQPDHAPEWVVTAGLVADADARMLRVVLTNLLGNAWKFTSQRAGARIEVGALPAEEAAGTLPEGWVAPPGSVFFVRDNGAGFDMAYADKLFGAFQRLHSHQEFAGTGIGLALAQRIIHRHGGLVWAQAKLNQGATFYFTLNHQTNNSTEA